MMLRHVALPQIHALLEADFVPLELCARLVPLLDALEGLNRPLSPASPVPDAALGQYKRALQQARVVLSPLSLVLARSMGSSETTVGKLDDAVFGALLHYAFVPESHNPRVKVP